MFWYVYPDSEKLAQACADFIAAEIEQTLKAQQLCHVALPGGNTPVRTFQLLARKALDWQRIVWIPGDERCLAEGDDQRNDRMIRENLCSLLPNADANLITFPIQADCQQAAQAMSLKLESIGRLDIALLGMGEDGHTASLFPGNPALELQSSAVAVTGSPKPPDQRISLGLQYLQTSRVRVVLCQGTGKRQIIERIMLGDEFPVTMIGQSHWFIDQAANGAKP